MRLDLTKIQVAAVAAMLRDELDEDERLYLDTLEGETDLYELVRLLLNEIEKDEGDQAVLAEQIESRKSRKHRLEARVESNRTAIMALLGCANLEKLTLPEATVSTRRLPPKAFVTDEASIPDDLCRFTRKPDMAAIKAALESGRAVSGTSLDNGGQSITIRRK